jgi:hypothetical protein
MDVIFESLEDYKSELLGDNFTDEIEEEIENKCTWIEEQEDFKKLFFFIDSDNSEYYYTEDTEQKIIDYLSQYIEVNNLKYPDLIFRDLCQDLLDNRECKDFEFETCWGKFVIDETNFIETLNEEFLGEEKIVDELIKATNFIEQFKEVKKDCLNYLVDMSIDEIRSSISSYKF